VTGCTSTPPALTPPPLIPIVAPNCSAFGVAWMCQDTVDATVVQGLSGEVLIVGEIASGAVDCIATPSALPRAGIDNTPQRTWEYTYSYDPTVGDGGGADAYLDFLSDTVIPIVTANYRVRGGGPWQVLGSSLGGLVSCYAAWTRPSAWTTAGCMSSSFWWNSEDFRTVVIPSVPPPATTSLYLDSGDAGPDDDDKNQTLAVLHTLEGLGYAVRPANEAPQSLGYYLDHGGQHSEAYWGARFHVPVQWAFPLPLQVAGVSGL